MSNKHEKLTIDGWVKAFENGEFEASDFKTQVDAGWYDWFCSDRSLATKTKRLGVKVKKIAKLVSKEFKDDHYVWFKNNCPGHGTLYDDIRFTSRSKDHNTLVVTPRSGHYNDEGKASIWGASNDFQGPLYEGDWKGALQFIKDLNL